VDVIDRLDAVRESWNVLRHPFYLRWSAGTLERSELAFYAGEYRHAVVALAEATARAAEEAEPQLSAELSRHADEEAAHVSLWDDFVAALGAETDRPARPKTADCASAWARGEGLLERLAVLYAVESAQPAVSQAKLDGLCSHYGMARTGRRPPTSRCTRSATTCTRRSRAGCCGTGPARATPTASSRWPRMPCRGTGGCSTESTLSRGAEGRSGGSEQARRLAGAL
jgi:TENA/THI-4/PQQC family